MVACGTADPQVDLGHDSSQNSFHLLCAFSLNLNSSTCSAADTKLGTIFPLNAFMKRHSRPSKSGYHIIPDPIEASVSLNIAWFSAPGRESNYPCVLCRFNKEILFFHYELILSSIHLWEYHTRLLRRVLLCCFCIEDCIICSPKSSCGFKQVTYSLHVSSYL